MRWGVGMGQGWVMGCRSGDGGMGMGAVASSLSFLGNVESKQ